MHSVRRLELLCLVARTGSLSTAARELNYTPSAVSQHITALERETRSQLVERGPRGARLTQAGALLVEHAHGILSRLEQAQRALDDLRELRAGRLRLASFHSAGAALMPDAVAEFRTRYPGVEVDVRDTDPTDAARLVRDAEVDAALTFRYSDLPPAKAMNDVEQLPLLDDPVHLALPAGHALAVQQSIDVADLTAETWVGCDTATCAPLLPRVAHRAGFEPTIAYQSSDYATILGFVAAGVGVALVPQLALTAPSSPRIVIRPTTDLPTRRISLITPAGRQRSPATNAMTEIMRTTAGRHTTTGRARTRIGTEP